MCRDWWWWRPRAPTRRRGSSPRPSATPIRSSSSRRSSSTSRPAAPVPEEPYAIPIGKAAVKREGTDVTLVATMAMVPRALAAAESLARQGHSVEVIDPRTLKPLDEETLLASVRKTRRLVVAHEACLTGGFGAEVAALVAEKAFDWLDAPVARVAALDTPMPYNEALERAVIPSQQRIADAVRETLAY